MQFAGESGAESLPVALHDGAQIVVLLPVLRDLGIDFAGALVEDGLGVAVVADRAEDRLPGVELLAGAAVRPLHEFVAVHLFHGRSEEAVGLPHGRAWNTRVGTLDPEGVL